MNKEMEEIAKEINRLKQEINTLEISLRNYKPGTDVYNGIKNRINAMTAQVKSLELRLKPPAPTNPDKPNDPSKPNVPHSNVNDIQELRNIIFLLEVALKDYKPGTAGYNALISQISTYRTMLKQLEDPDSSNPVTDPTNETDTTTTIIVSVLAVGGLFLAYKYI